MTHRRRPVTPWHIALLCALAAPGPACKDHPAHDAARSTPPAATTAAKPPAPAADWCQEHGLPESKCTKCNPSLIGAFKQAGDWCASHGFPESVCPICKPAKPPAGVAPAGPFPAGTRIRLRSPQIEREAGIGFVAVERAAVATSVTCPARIRFDANRVAEVRAAVAGVVKRVLVDLGDSVKKGARLFVLESARIGDLQGQRSAARQRVVVARAHLDRQQALSASGISSTRQVELARQELANARASSGSLEQSLAIAGGAAAGQSGRYVLRAPLAGAVVRRPAKVGTFASGQTLLATIADTRAMWAIVDVREADAASVKRGQTVGVQVAGVAARIFSGKVTWVAPEVDRRTRTVPVRVQLDNACGALRAHQFGTATIQVAAPETAVAVPRDALQRLRGSTVVFVRTGAGVYEPRVVQVGRRSGDRVQITGPVRVGDRVVHRGAFLLKTELTKESIGAGCCEIDSKGKRR